MDFLIIYLFSWNKKYWNPCGSYFQNISFWKSKRRKYILKIFIFLWISYLCVSRYICWCDNERLVLNVPGADKPRHGALSAEPLRCAVQRSDRLHPHQSRHAGTLSWWITMEMFSSFLNKFCCFVTLVMLHFYFRIKIYIVILSISLILVLKCTMT